MTYKTILTSKGTTTIPVEIRKKLGIEPGMYVSFTQDSETGDYVIKRSQTIEEVRLMNKKALDEAGTAHKNYQSGDGVGAFVKGKYGEPLNGSAPLVRDQRA